jgi:hypothetical protein
MESKLNWVSIVIALFPTLTAIGGSYVSIQKTLNDIQSDIRLEHANVDNRITNNDKHDFEQDKALNEVMRRMDDYEYWIKGEGQSAKPKR